MLKFPPSLLAAAAIFTAQCTIIGSKQWSKTSQCECSKHVVTLHQNAATGKLLTGDPPLVVGAYRTCNDL
ncbi:unnamed protein product [Rhodiola kirilowii]